MTHTITKQQDHILTLLIRFRFLTRRHIQTSLNHKNHTRITTWLKDLTTQDYIGQIYSNAAGENTKPAVYYLKLKGIQAIREQAIYPKDYLRKLYRESERSTAFISKCLLLADICLELQRKRHGHIDDFPLYEAFTASDLWASSPPILMSLPLDLVIRKSAAKNSKEYFLLEVLETTFTRPIIRRRILDFIRFYRGGEWEESTEVPFPTLLLACPTKAMLISAKRTARKLLEEAQSPEDISIWVAMTEDMKTQGMISKIWEPVPHSTDSE